MTRSSRGPGLGRREKREVEARTLESVKEKRKDDRRELRSKRKR